MTNEQVAATFVQAGLITDNGDGTYSAGEQTLTLAELVQSRQVIRYLFGRISERQRRLVINGARLVADRYSIAFPAREPLTRERALIDLLATEVQEILNIRGG